MNKLFTKIASFVLGLGLAIGVGVSVSSNKVSEARATSAALSLASGSGGAGTMKFNGTNYSGVKIGASSKTGTAKFTVAAGATSCSFFAAGWGGKSVTLSLSITTGTINPNTKDIKSDNGVAGSGNSFTIEGTNESDYKHTFTLSGVTKSADISITTASSGDKRAALWNASYEISSSDPIVKLDQTKALDYVNHSFSLKATASNFASAVTYTWSSDSTGIVEISNTGGDATVTPKKAGNTTITVSASDGSATKTATCAVTVTSKSGADASNSMNVDDVILLAKYQGESPTTANYYMEGVVTGFYNNKYPLLNGETIDDDVEIYVDCSSKGVFVGDTVRAYGKVKNYNSTQPEFDTGTTVTVTNVPVSSISGEVSAPITTDSTGNLADHLSVTVSGTNSRQATNKEWKVTNSSNTEVLSISGEDGKTFSAASSVGTTTLTIASVADPTKTCTVDVTLFDSSIPVLKSVTVGGTPSKSTQYVGKTFDYTGLTFTPVYDPVKDPVESITGANIEWDALVAGQNPTGTYTGDDEVEVTVTVTSVSVEADGIFQVFVSDDMNNKSYDEDASWNYDGLTVEVTYKSDHDTKVAPTSEITWSADKTPKQLGVGTDKTVNVTATVAGVSSSAYQISGIEVTEHLADKYGEYTGDISAGKFVIFESNNAMTAQITSNRFANTSVTQESGIITDPDASIVWTFEKIESTSYWLIYNGDKAKCAGGTGSKNQGKLIDCSTTIDDLAKWTITFDADSGYTFHNYGRSQKESDWANAYLRHNGDSGWATYASGTGAAPQLYKLNYLPKAFDHFDYVDATPDRTNYQVGDPFDPTGLIINAVYTEPSIYPAEDITSEIEWDALEEGNKATGSWQGHDVEITGLTITSFTPVLYKRVSSVAELSIGSQVIFGGYSSSTKKWFILTTVYSTGKYFSAAEATLSGNDMYSTETSTVFTVEADSNGYYFKNGSNYISRNGSDSAFTSKSANSVWSLSFSSTEGFTMKNGTSGNTDFEFNGNNGQERFKNYSGGQQNVWIFVKEDASETDVLKTYVTRYLNPTNEDLENIPSSSTGISGTSCKDNGYYINAKKALVSGEFSSFNESFQESTDTIIENARLRYNSWAAACGDTTPYAGDGIVKAAMPLALFGTNSSASTIAIVVVSVLAVTAIGGYFFIRKRKELN